MYVCERPLTNGYLYEMLVGLFNELVIDRDSSNWTNGSLLDIAEYRNGLAMQKYRPDQDDRAYQS